MNLISVFTYGCADLDIPEANEKLDSRTKDISRSAETKYTCGTSHPEPPTWYFTALDPRALDSGIITLNVYFHIIRSSSGLGLDKQEVSQTIINRLNNDFKIANINFYSIGSEYIDSDDLNLLDYSESKKIFKQNPHNNAIDIYVFSDGKNLGTLAGKAEDIISSALLITGWHYKDFTPVHEMGHCFGLYHTHHGTSKQEPSGIPELVNGSNSDVAGDYMTDTPADPCVWSMGEYIGTGTDANGEYYNPDPTNIMSYSWSINQNRFSSEQIKKMRSIIFYDEGLRKTIHERKIIGPKHFSSSANFSIDVLNLNEDVEWIVTKYSKGVVSKQVFNTHAIHLESQDSEYFEILANIQSQNDTHAIVAYSTSNAPSPYIGDLYWETNCGQFGITNISQFGNTLYVSGNTSLNLSYTDKAGNNNLTLNEFNFTCVTSNQRVLKGSKISITPSDCINNLKIRTQDACGSSEYFFTIPCKVMNYYYNIKIQDRQLFISKKYVENLEIENILSKREPEINKTPNEQNILIYNESNQVVYSKESIDEPSTFSIDINNLKTGQYTIRIQDVDAIHHFKFSL